MAVTTRILAAPSRAKLRGHPFLPDLRNLPCSGLTMGNLTRMSISTTSMPSSTSVWSVRPS
ncbi:hypothetical protein A2U01_0067704, partial [Trifolium medium]|nr:hypothetical protein [Trifolium medium]